MPESLSSAPESTFACACDRWMRTARVDETFYDEVGMPLPLPRALAYSAGVLTFQRPEPRPATPAAQIVVRLEALFGPAQAALLALAIRRKF